MKALSAKMLEGDLFITTCPISFLQSLEKSHAILLLGLCQYFAISPSTIFPTKLLLERFYLICQAVLAVVSIYGLRKSSLGMDG